MNYNAIIANYILFKQIPVFIKLYVKKQKK